jgi:hypothetical protein
MNGDKAQSPDGYSLAFFQACWVLKEDITKSSRIVRPTCSF